MFDIDIQELLDRFKIPILLVLSICAVISGVLVFLDSAKGEEEIRFLTEEEVAQIKGIQEQKVLSEKWFVDVAGQVKSPGVIEVEPGITLLRVIEKAGGFTKKADMYHVQKEMNLAQAVEDRQKVYVPAIGELAVTQASSQQVDGSASSTSSLVNVNTATADELDTLSGVGPATAEKIIDARPFSSVEDIKRVSGIGDATFEKIKDQIII